MSGMASSRPGAFCMTCHLRRPVRAPFRTGGAGHPESAVGRSVGHPAREDRDHRNDRPGPVPWGCRGLTPVPIPGNLPDRPSHAIPESWTHTPRFPSMRGMRARLRARHGRSGPRCRPYPQGVSPALQDCAPWRAKTMSPVGRVHDHGCTMIRPRGRDGPGRETARAAVERPAQPQAWPGNGDAAVPVVTRRPSKADTAIHGTAGSVSTDAGPGPRDAGPAPCYSSAAHPYPGPAEIFRRTPEIQRKTPCTRPS
jgi:hypothetical protein